MKSSLQSFFASPAASILLVILGLPSASPSQDQQPTAAEMSKKETVASALLRTASLQEYEVRSAAEAMPENLHAYRPGKENSRAKSLLSALPKCAPSRSKSSTWHARTSRSSLSSMANSLPRCATKAAPIPPKRNASC